MDQEFVQSSFKRGVATLCIMALLHQQPMYGYELVAEMSRISDGEFVLPEGTLYPILYRLEDSGYLLTEKKLVGKRMTRVYYSLSESGEQHYQELLKDYLSIRNGVAKILGR
jgi:PadR family transcriptional regulator PadR